VGSKIVKRNSPIENPEVAAVFASHPPHLQERLLALRALILKPAQATPGVGRIEETLKWGQISYLTPDSRSGTTLRIDAEGDGTAIFVNCQTDLVQRYKALYPETFGYAGERAVLLAADSPIDEAALGHCVALALTYHLAKRRK
jgi:hypothetical protein